MKTNANSVNKGSSFFSKHADVLVPVVLLVLAAFAAIFHAFSKMDLRFYNIMLRLSPEVEHIEDLVIVDIDDESIASIDKNWPWPRDIMADVLIRMKEFGAARAVFDIEYLTPSEKAVADDLEQTARNEIDSAGQSLTESVDTLFEAVSQGTISSDEAKTALEDSIGGVLYEMKRNIEDGFNKDNDDYFARAIQFFGNANLTVNMRNIGIRREDSENAYVNERFLFSNVSDPHNLIASGNAYSVREEGKTVSAGFIPALDRLVRRAAGVGFTNVVVDKDGTRRRVELLCEHEGKYVGQLAFAPLAAMLDIQSMERTSHSLLLRGVLSSDGTRHDVRIPLDSHGRMLINWLKEPYENSFVHIPIWRIYNMEKEEAVLAGAVQNLLSADLGLLNEEDREKILSAQDFADEYKNLEHEKSRLLRKCRGFDVNGKALKGGITDDDYENYFSRRRKFFSRLNEFAQSVKNISSAESVPEISRLCEASEGFCRDSQTLEEMLSGSFCFIGNSATSSTDLGVTPFSKRYPNLGTHANIVNTILQKAFITELSALWGIALAFVFSMLCIVLCRNMTQGKKNAVGLSYVIATVCIIVAAMVFLRIYIPVFIPLLLAVCIYIAELVVNFIRVNGEKKHLRTSFGSYVSPLVVAELERHPEKAKLVGGESKIMTALFSDVKTFSGFTETINNVAGEDAGAEQLVKILNIYLGALSDEIMNCKGTIDKYVGDEIVSFFGAPIDDPDNAFSACEAAVRMLKAEEKFNIEYKDMLPVIKSTGEPFYLHSRVGLNTGNMVVGNMGTEKKLNYTIMGNNVNLASRLEGTNKVYGSWIMASDSTWKAASSSEKNKAKNLVARHMDFVRVVNVDKPVRIHNLIGFEGDIPSARLEAAQLFNEGMKWYLNGIETPAEKKNHEDFKKAIACFKQAAECYPEDLSSDVFIKRCSDFLREGTPSVWDGVFTMSQK